MSSENSNGHPEEPTAAPESPAVEAAARRPSLPAPPVPPVPPVPPAPPSPQAVAPGMQTPYAMAPGGPAGPGQPHVKKGGFPAWAWWVIAGGVALLALITVAVALFFAQFGSGGPQAVAEEYVNSLNDEDTTRANELARVSDGDKRLVVLTSDAFAEAEGATEFKIESFRHRDDLAMAEVSYLVDGSKLSDYIEVTRDGDGWYVSSGLTYRLPTIFASGVEGYRMPGFDGVIGSDLDLQAYPGTYTMLSPSSLFDLVTDTTFEVGASIGFASVEPEFEPTQQYFDQVDEAMRSHIDSCLNGLGNSDVYSLSSCGISAYAERTYSVDSFEVKIDEYPTAGIDSRYSGVAITDAGAVAVTINGRQIGGEDGTETVNGDFGGLHFTTAVSGDTVDVEFY